MWALGKLGRSKKKSAAVVRSALQQKNPDLRVAGLRLARQLSHQLYIAHLQDAAVIKGPSPAVRRELLIGMHEVKPKPTSQAREEVISNAWAQLAQYYDGNDRWYLEALGIAADGRWDACLSALSRDKGEEWKSNKAGRDILWRSRGSNTSEQIAAVIRNPATPAEETPRFFRALDFQPEEFKQQVLPSLAFGEYPNFPRERVFLLSTTHGAETHELAAAIATMRFYLENPVVEALYTRGRQLRVGFEAAVMEAGLEGYVDVSSRDCNLLFATRDADRKPSQTFRTLFMQEMIARGVIAPSLVVSWSHGDDDIRRTLDAIFEALRVYRRAIDDGTTKYLSGRPVKPVFRRFA
jgi:hypothetical protein